MQTNKYKINSIIAIILAILTFILSSCTTFSQINDNTKVNVTLENNEHVKVVSKNSIQVPLHSNATFEVIVEDGYKITYVKNGSYKKNHITIKNILAPTTVQYTVEFLEDISNVSTEKLKKLKYNFNKGISTLNNKVLFFDDLYSLPNTYLLNDNITKNSYALLGYETDDGEFYGTGWNVKIKKGETKILKCKWVKYSEKNNFTFKTIKNEISITSYKGNEELIVIPEYINGKKVTSISKNAFNNTTCKKIYFTRFIKSIAEKAINQCINLETIYICDNITSMKNNSIEKCDKLKHLYINATKYPCMEGSELDTCQVKFERLLTSDSPKVILVSGSSSRFGFNSPLFEELTKKHYHVTNYGVHANTALTFYLELCSSFINSKDIVIAAPEMYEEQMGSTSFNNLLWITFEGAFGAFSYVDISHFKNVFASFAWFNKSREIMSETSYENGKTPMNKYGDDISNRPTQQDDYVTFVNGPIDYPTSLFVSDNINNLNRVFDLIINKGGKVWFSFPPVNINSLTNEGKTSNMHKNYETLIDQNLHVTRISNIEKYILNGKNFYGTDYHLGNDGAKLRTNLLASDFLEELSKQGD